MKDSTNKKLLKLIGELESIQDLLEREKEFNAFDEVGNCVETLTCLLNIAEK